METTGGSTGTALVKNDFARPDVDGGESGHVDASGLET
jgi:hypothetical protein